MTSKLFEKLRVPNHPLLAPNLYGLQCWGLWQPTQLSKYFYNTIHLLATLFVISQYVELWLIRNDLRLALRNLSVTMLSSICVYKASTFVLWQKSWKELVYFVSSLEKHQISRNDSSTLTLISEYTSYSRKITRFYWSLVTATVFTVILSPLFGVISSKDYRERISNGTEPYPEILSSWLPFDRTKGYGYWMAVLEHSLICFYGGGVVASYDSNAVVIMSFITGQLKILSENCANLFGDGKEVLDYKVAMKRVKCYHNHHLNLIRYSSILNSLLSPVMFLYVIICSLMICASAFQLTMEDTSNVQRMWVAEYLFALIAQLFLYCWHCNEVLSMSNQVYNGIYNSAWWSQSLRVRSTVVLLSGQLQKPIVFTAGPFTQLNVATFLTILKGSYSYYTLLNKKDV